MNPDQNKHWLLTLFLALGLMLVGFGLYQQALAIQQQGKRLDAIAKYLVDQPEGYEYGPPPNIEQNDCVSSGGEYQNNECMCGTNYFLENGSCMGQDGLTKKVIEEIKAGQEKIMGDTDRGMPNETITVSGLTFEIPLDWSVVSQTGSRVMIRVPDPKYTVTIPFEVRKISAQDRQSLDLRSRTLIAKTVSGASLYQEACAPTLLCQYIEYNEMIYLATFEEPESNEQPPSDLDGVWFPRTTVTQEELAVVIRSVR